MSKTFSIICAVTLITTSGCMTAAEHSNNISLSESHGEELTVGVVQKEISMGLSQSQVAAKLGSPNIVTSDSQGVETWIYDKISSETVYSKSSVGATILLVGGSNSSGASATRQKTLTIIIKFKEGVVDDFSYHASKF